MHVHEEVLQTANRLAAPDGSFSLNEVVEELRHLNENTVRTHVVSRCCVDAPKNHPHIWGYFRRIGRGKYQILPKYRAYRSRRTTSSNSKRVSRRSGDFSTHLAPAVHAIVRKDGPYYVVECMEIAVVTQGRSLDEAAKNLSEAVRLHLGGEDPETTGVVAEPRIEMLYDMVLACPA